MKRTTVLFLVLVALVLLLAVTAGAYSVQTVKGTVNASAIEAGDLVLTGNTTIVMDKDLSLRSISGNYALTVQDAGGHTMTVRTPLDEQTITANGSGHAISVASFTSDVDLNLTARKDGLNIDREINITGGTVKINCGGDAIYSRNRYIGIKNATLDLTAGHGCVVTKNGGANVAVSGTGTLKTTGASSYCVVGSNVDLNGTGTLTLSSVSNTVVSYGELLLSGKISATCTAENSVALNARNSSNNGQILLRSGAEVTATGGSTGLYAQDSIVMQAGAKSLTATGNRDYGIMAEKGEITLRGTVDVTAVGTAVCSPKGGIDQKTGTLTAKTTGKDCSGVSASSISFEGDSVRVEAQASAVVANGSDIWIKSYLTAVTTREDCAAIKAQGEVQIDTGVSVNVSSAGAGIYAKRDIWMNGGDALTVRADTQRGLEAGYNIYLRGIVDIKAAKDAVNSGHMIWLGGNTTIECTGEDYYAVRAYQEMTGNQVKWIAGSVYLNAGHIRIKSAGGGIYAGELVRGFQTEDATTTLYLDLNNKLEIDAGKWHAIRVENGSAELAGTIALHNKKHAAVTVSEYPTAKPEHGQEKLSIEGFLTLTADQGYGIYCPRFEMDCSTGSYIHSYVFCVCSTGDATLRGGALRLYSETATTIDAEGNIRLAADSVEAICNYNHNPVFRSAEGNYLIECPITALSKSAGGVFSRYSKGSIEITPPLTIVKPAGGYVEKKSASQYSARIVDPANPNLLLVSDVEIGTNGNVIGGSIELKDGKTVALVGDTLELAFINCDAADRAKIEWQLSENGFTWTTIPGETADTYRVRARDAGKYLRARATATAYAGELVTEPCFVTATNALTGGIVYTSAIRYSNPLSPAQTARTGKLAQIEAADPSRVHFQWQRSEDGLTGWTDIKKSESATALTSTYNVGSESCGKYIRLTATVDGMVGTVVGSAKYVAKLPGKLAPENYPRLTTAEPYTSVTVTNAQTTQEYLLTTGATSPKDWSGAITPASNGSLTFSCSAGQLVFVHTRVKETAYRGPSDSVYSAIYTGTAAVTQHPEKLTFDKTKINTKVGEVTQLTVRPLPADFDGWDSYTVRWYSNTGLGGVELYADKDCTQKLTTSTTTQHTIWVKGVKQVQATSVGCERQIGYNELIHDSCSVRVADANGNYVLEGLFFENITVFPGESAQLAYTAKPVPSTVNGAITMVKGQGANPTDDLQFEIDGGTITVTAPENAALGTYYYEARVDGKKLDYVSGIQITVADKTATVSFDPGNPGAKYYARPTLMATGMASQTVPLGAQYILPENGFDAPDGYEFAGWDLGGIGDGVNITQDTRITATWKTHEHAMRHVDATASVCTVPGHMEYYYCETCGKLYGDAAGAYPVTDMAMLRLPAPGHTAVGPTREIEIP